MSKPVKEKNTKKGTATIEVIVFDDGSSEHVTTITVDDGTEFITVTQYGPCTDPLNPCK